ncbi:hypothetical protein PVAND_015678 [Polypedilum vanderplanki]|uniref:Serine/threonine protein kinase n=1 Tax=Polypedilum vanderplanki TaxID=319348 RepID=A0A9J6BDV9_POLVA|nr:hypothetical protein PVAND_015678 [Polypedilum vanderplanki]
MLSDYELDKQIGRGGFGTVYRARNKKNNNIVAIKMMLKSKIYQKEKYYESVLREAKINKHLNGCNFVSHMISCFTSVNSYNFVLELASTDLYSLIHERRSNLTKRDLKILASQLFQGLSEIHKNNIMHRDLKPSNLLITEDGVLKICDFGQATYINDGVTGIAGTPGYIAPEVLNKQKYNECADYYACGSIIYEMFLKKRAFDARDNDKIVQKSLKEILDIDNKLDLPVHSIVQKLGQKNPLFRLYGIEKVKHQSWFCDENWNKLLIEKLTISMQKQEIREKCPQSKEFNAVFTKISSTNEAQTNKIANCEAFVQTEMAIFNLSNRNDKIYDKSTQTELAPVIEIKIPDFAGNLIKPQQLYEPMEVTPNETESSEMQEEQLHNLAAQEQIFDQIMILDDSVVEPSRIVQAELVEYLPDEQLKTKNEKELKKYFRQFIKPLSNGKVCCVLPNCQGKPNRGIFASKSAYGHIELRTIKLREGISEIIGSSFVVRESAVNSLRFKTEKLSINHAEIYFLGNDFFLKDNGSRYGTYVNGVQIGPLREESDPVKIYSMDIVKFGTSDGSISAMVQLFLPDYTEPIRPLAEGQTLPTYAEMLRKIYAKGEELQH